MPLKNLMFMVQLFCNSAGHSCQCTSAGTNHGNLAFLRMDMLSNRGDSLLLYQNSSGIALFTKILGFRKAEKPVSKKKFKIFTCLYFRFLNPQLLILNFKITWFQKDKFCFT